MPITSRMRCRSDYSAVASCARDAATSVPTYARLGDRMSKGGTDASWWTGRLTFSGNDAAEHRHRGSRKRPLRPAGQRLVSADLIVYYDCLVHPGRSMRCTTLCSLAVFCLLAVQSMALAAANKRVA